MNCRKEYSQVEAVRNKLMREDNEKRIYEKRNHSLVLNTFELVDGELVQSIGSIQDDNTLFILRIFEISNTVKRAMKWNLE